MNDKRVKKLQVHYSLGRWVAIAYTRNLNYAPTARRYENISRASLYRIEALTYRSKFKTSAILGHGAATIFITRARA